MSNLRGEIPNNYHALVSLYIYMKSACACALNNFWLQPSDFGHLLFILALLVRCQVSLTEVWDFQNTLHTIGVEINHDYNEGTTQLESGCWMKHIVSTGAHPQTSHGTRKEKAHFKGTKIFACIHAYLPRQVHLQSEIYNGEVCGSSRPVGVLQNARNFCRFFASGWPPCPDFPNKHLHK